MPCYEFQCQECLQEYEIFMSFAEYDEFKDKQKCECCKSPLQRVYSNPPAIKTEMRLEDLWKKHGILDPEDPEYAKRARDRIKMMRDKAKKKKEKEIEKLGNNVKMRRMRIKSDDRSLDQLPDSNKSQSSITDSKKDKK